MSLTEKLADFACSLDYEDFSQALVDTAKLHILDAIGVGLLGSKLHAQNPTIKTLQTMGGMGTASVFGHSLMLQPNYAAFANGMLLNGHFQPTHRATLAHPHAPCIAAAFATGEDVSASGKAVISAVIAAYDVFLRICAAVSPSHLARGLQTTGTIAPFGAAVASAKLMGFDRERMKHALNHAANFSGAGLIAAHGAKPYYPVQVGINVWKGMMAAFLARDGLPGYDWILEGGSSQDKGFLQAYSDQYDAEIITADLGIRYEIVQTGFKLHHAASFSLTPIDAAQALVREHGLKLDEIKEIKVKIAPVLYSFVKEKITTVRAEAREATYYIPFHIALALVKGKVDTDMYTDECFNDPEIQKVMQKVTSSADPGLGQDYSKTKSVMSSIVEMKTGDGRIFTRRLDYPRGNPENPASKEELQNKFRTLATKVISQQAVEEIVELVDGLERVQNIHSLTRLIQQEGSQ